MTKIVVATLQTTLFSFSVPLPMIVCTNQWMAVLPTPSFTLFRKRCAIVHGLDLDIFDPDSSCFQQDQEWGFLSCSRIQTGFELLCLLKKRYCFFAWLIFTWTQKGVGLLVSSRGVQEDFRPPWPTLPGPGCQPLDGSISLKFLLETRLQSESFDTLDDLLGFRVQKLWSVV